MDLISIKAKNFRPRTDILENGENLTLDELARSQEPGEVKVVLADQGPSFLISAVARSKNKLFSSEALFFKTKLWGWPRDWQLTALLQVLRDLIRQMEKPQPKAPSREASAKIDL